MAEQSKPLSHKSTHGKWYNKQNNILSFFLTLSRSLCMLPQLLQMHLSKAATIFDP